MLLPFRSTALHVPTMLHSLVSTAFPGQGQNSKAQLTVSEQGVEARDASSAGAAKNRHREEASVSSSSSSSQLPP